MSNCRRCGREFNSRRYPNGRLYTFQICPDCKLKPRYSSHRNNVPISPIELERLYLEDELSADDIGRRYNVRGNLIRARLIELNLPIRTWSQAAKNRMAHGQNQVFGQKGKDNPAWKGGRHMRGEYWNVWAPEHPRNNGGYVYEHILVWEKEHGQLLPDGWITHHIDGIKTHNVSENIIAMPRERHDKLIPELIIRINNLESENKKLVGVISSLLDIIERR